MATFRETLVCPDSKAKPDPRESLASLVLRVPPALLVKKEKEVPEESPELPDHSDLQERGYVTRMENNSGKTWHC